MTEFSGGQVIFNSANYQFIDGDKELIKKESGGAHPWNAATNHPKPPASSPKPPPDRFLLEVKLGDSVATARCASMALLLDLNQQFEEIGYHFVKLERIEDD